jgi:hypothetical protein
MINYNSLLKDKTNLAIETMGSSEALAVALGVKNSTIVKWGKAKNLPSFDKWLMLCEIIDKTVTKQVTQSSNNIVSQKPLEAIEEIKSKPESKPEPKTTITTTDISDDDELSKITVNIEDENAELKKIGLPLTEEYRELIRINKKYSTNKNLS